MIDLTPLDVRKKRGDFKKMLRGYDPQEVDTFLELVAERLEVLVKESMTLQERTELLAEQVKSQQGREKAIQEALVTAQTLREDIAQQAAREAEAIREQAKREAEMVTRQAEAEARQLRDKVDAEVSQLRQQAVGDTELLRKQTEGELERLTHELEGLIESKTGIIDELERKRTRFLRAFRSLLERELDAVAIEEGKVASEDSILELDLTGGQRRVQARMIETAALDMLQDEAGEVEGAPAAEHGTDSAVDLVLGPTESGDHPQSAGALVDSETGDGAEYHRDSEGPSAEGADAGPEEDVGGASVEMPGEAELDQAVDAVLVDDSSHGAQPAAEAPVQESAVAVEEAGDASTDSADLDLRVGGPSPEEAQVDTLVDQAFTILDETPVTPDGADGASDPESRGEPVVESLMTEHGPRPTGDEVISIQSLAPESREPFEDEARAAVNELFDRGDVPVAPPEAPAEDVEDAWSKVLRGEEGSGEDTASEGKGSWSPNFPDKGRKSDGSGWMRSKDPSRWR